MLTIKGTDIELHIRKFCLNEINDTIGDFFLLSADRHQFGFADACHLQHVFALSVAKIDTETETTCRADLIGGIINHRYVRTTGEQDLRSNLPVTGKADHQNIRACAFKIFFNTVFLFGGCQQTVADGDRQWCQRHGNGYGSDQF